MPIATRVASNRFIPFARFFPYVLGQPSLSPCGRRIVYTGWDAGGGGDGVTRTDFETVVLVVRRRRMRKGLCV